MRNPDELSSRARQVRSQGWDATSIASALHLPATPVDAWLAPEAQSPTPALSFEDWVQYLFDNPPGYRWFDHLTVGEELSSAVLVEYLTRLFTEAGTVLMDFSDAQINQTLWFLIGEGSDGAFALFDQAVPWAARRACLLGTLTLFTDCFRPRCTPSLSHLDEPASPLNAICYMWWDLFPTWGTPDNTAHAELDALVLNLFERILDLPSDACNESALHGLGHWMARYPHQVEDIIDTWLDRQTVLRPELRRYALAARSGCIQ